MWCSPTDNVSIYIYILLLDLIIYIYISLLDIIYIYISLSIIVRSYYIYIYMGAPQHLPAGMRISKYVGVMFFSKGPWIPFLRAEGQERLKLPGKKGLATHSKPWETLIYFNTGWRFQVSLIVCTKSLPKPMLFYFFWGGAAVKPPSWKSLGRKGWEHSMISNLTVGANQLTPEPIIAMYRAFLLCEAIQKADLHWACPERRDWPLF